MEICGLQKLTLLDYPGKVACTVFTGGCNFRCPFCHNASLLKAAPPAACIEEELFAFLEKRRGVLDGVCVTGGEPLLHSGLKDFLLKIKSLGYSVKLDTNGSLPDRLIEAVRSGAVDFVAMDIKNSLGKYAVTTGLDICDTASVKRSIDFLLSGEVDYEFRTTVVYPLHNEDDFYGIGMLIKGARRYYLQGFVDSGDILSEGMGAYDKDSMELFLGIAKRFVPGAEIRGM